MIARLYRGPKNGKKYHVADSEQYIMLYSHKPRDWSMANDCWYPNKLTVAMNSKTHIYRRTNHTHPDGSVFFEWDRPKGTKI